MMPLVLDTNALIWLRDGHPQLGMRAKEMADEAIRNGMLYVSAFTFWEVAMLASKGKLDFFGSANAWRERVIADGVQELPLTGEIAVVSVELFGDMPNDPADRIIAATAMTLSATLVTADGKLLRWDGPLNRHDARV